MYWRMAPPYSGYNDFNDVDIARLKHALDDIHATADAHHARMAVILIPTSNDFVRLKQFGANRLGPVVLSWGQEKGIPVKDLLPDMDGPLRRRLPHVLFKLRWPLDAEGEQSGGGNPRALAGPVESQTVTQPSGLRVFAATRKPGRRNGNPHPKGVSYKNRQIG